MNSENLERFEKYHLDELPENERLAFEKDLETNESLANEYQNFVQIRNSLTNTDNERLRNKISEIIKQEKLSREIRIVSKNYWIAASLLVLFGLSFYFYGIYPSKNEKLYSEFHTSYVETISVLSSNTSSFGKCLDLYNRADYAEAKNCFIQLPINAETSFFSAMCMLETEEYKSAIAALERVENLGNTYLEESNWYLALVYLRENEHEETKLRLNNILNNSKSSYKKESARRLLSRI
jgi:hypothetical protein